MAGSASALREVIEIIDYDDFVEIGDDRDTPPLDNYFDASDESDAEEDLIQEPTTTALCNAALSRNGPILPPHAVCDNHPYGSSIGVARGSTWKLKAQHRDLALLLFVRQILKDLSTDEVLVRGLPMFPNKRLKGMLDWGGYAKYNAYLSVKVDRDDYRPWHVQGMVECPLDSLDRPITCEFSPLHYDRSASAETAVHVTCRRVLIESFSSAAERLQKPARKLDIEYTLHTLSVRCIAELQGAVDTSGQQCMPATRGHPYDRSIPTSRQCTRDYTYVSAFSGGGGDCRGAKDAGLNVTCAIDNHEPATRTMRLNFPNTAVLCDDVSNLPLYGRRPCCICHLSPCCQPHSQAHTIPGRNDDANYLTSLSCKNVIDFLQPDIVTLENVAGLMRKKSSVQWFATLINQLAETGRGYNVRWKLVDFREYGLVPRRTRFVAFASRRGVPLPPFPQATHGPRGSRPFATIHKALRKLSRRPFLTHNEIPTYCTVFQPPRPPYDARTRVLGCITTNGGENVHPSGARTFTLRELAYLNGIPLDYQFPYIAEAGIMGGLAKSEILKQIGNCIPPAVWMQFLKSIRNTLQMFDAGKLDSDGISTMHYDRARVDSAGPEVIDVDGDSGGRPFITVDDSGIGGSATPMFECVPHFPRQPSSSMSRASSRTLSPEGRSESRGHAKRRRIARHAPSGSVIDLTGDD